jgi:hypothetical protein
MSLHDLVYPVRVIDGLSHSGILRGETTPRVAKCLCAEDHLLGYGIPIVASSAEQSLHSNRGRDIT